MVRVEEEQMNVEAMALQTMFQKAHHQPLGVLRKAHHQPVGVLRKAHQLLRKVQGEMLQKAQGDNSKGSMIILIIVCQPPPLVIKVRVAAPLEHLIKAVHLVRKSLEQVVRIRRVLIAGLRHLVRKGLEQVARVRRVLIAGLLHLVRKGLEQIARKGLEHLVRRVLIVGLLHLIGKGLEQIVRRGLEQVIRRGLDQLIIAKVVIAAGLEQLSSMVELACHVLTAAAQEVKGPRLLVQTSRP